VLVGGRFVSFIAVSCVGCRRERSTMKLYVGNLSSETTEQQLRDLVTPFGQPDSVAIVLDKATGKARGFGFVEFQNEAEAKAAIAGLNLKNIGGKPLTVNEARSKEKAAAAAPTV
jgi:cold-inducible RNA-binding protein